MKKQLLFLSITLFLFSCNKNDTTTAPVVETYEIFEMEDAHIDILGTKNTAVTTPANGTYTILFNANKTAVTINNDVFNRKGAYYASTSSNAFTAQFYNDTVSVNKYLGGSDVQHLLIFRAVKKAK